MDEFENLKALMVDYRNSIKESLSDDELGQVDTYIDKIVEDLKPAFALVSKLIEDEDQLATFKKELDKHMKEDKWLEKLLKTS